MGGAWSLGSEAGTGMHGRKAWLGSRTELQAAHPEHSGARSLLLCTFPEESWAAFCGLEDPCTATLILGASTAQQAGTSGSAAR